MGNRANINLVDHNLSIYLHSYGDPESVATFLLYADQVGVRLDDYFPSRLVQIVGNFLGGVLSLGIEQGYNTSCGDNGVYDVATDSGLKITHKTPYSSVFFPTLADFVASVSDHEYWTESEPILDQIAEANDQFFRRK